MPLSLCPSCGQPIAFEELMIDLNTNRAVRGGRLIQLTPSETIVLSTLNQLMPKTATFDQLYHALYGLGDEPDDPRGTLAQYIHFLRRHAPVLKYTITNVYGAGYRLQLLPMPNVSGA